MNRFIFIFTTQEIEYLAKKRPDLVPKKKPSLKDKLLEKPSLKDKLIDRPSLDQVILKFLSKYEVFIEPRSVGAWNGWDTISVLNPFLFNDGSTQSYLSDISSNIFFANRSNQIRSSAQEWNTWKRWALDHNDFEEYKKQFLKTVDIHNAKIKKEEEELIREATLNNQKVYTEEEKLIREAEFHNKKIIKVLEEPKAKLFISRLIKRDQLRDRKRKQIIINTLFGVFISLVLGYTFQSLLESQQEKKYNNLSELNLYEYNKFLF